MVGARTASQQSSVLGITDGLDAWSAGAPGALDDLMPLIYDQLRGLARRALACERPDHTLQPTALVHEVYLRLTAAQQVRWESRAHFFGATARLMRQILVDAVRRRRAAKRNCGATLVALDEIAGLSDEHGVDLLALEGALASLAEVDPRPARIVELRFFAGLTIPEVAAVLGLGTATVERDWRVAKAWLHHELRGN